jgi:hypothetical protein
VAKKRTGSGRMVISLQKLKGKDTPQYIERGISSFTCKDKDVEQWSENGKYLQIVKKL